MNRLTCGSVLLPILLKQMAEGALQQPKLCWWRSVSPCVILFFPLELVPVKMLLVYYLIPQSRAGSQEDLSG